MNSRVLRRDQQGQRTVRLHMWYPGAPIDWQNDPLITQDLAEMWDGAELLVAPAENPYHDGIAIMIERREVA